MREVLNVAKAISDQNRVRALMMLKGGELCVCQIIGMLRLAPSTVSKHMSILRQAGLVETRKEGRWIFYRLADRGSPAACEILAWLNRHLKSEAKVMKDTRNLCRVLKIDKDQLCARYRS